jgi:hypothetical protein
MVASVRWATVHNLGPIYPGQGPALALTPTENLAGAALGRRAAPSQRFLAGRRFARLAGAAFFFLVLILLLLLLLRATGGLTTL